jgi:hypothetical protein
MSSVHDKEGDSKEITPSVESRQIAGKEVDTKKIAGSDSRQDNTNSTDAPPLLDLPTVLLNGLMSFLCNASPKLLPSA